MSRDLDRFIAEAEEHRLLVDRLKVITGAMGIEFRRLRDAGSFVRGELVFEGGRIEVDVIHEPSPDLGEPPTVEGVVLCSGLDLRASRVSQASWAAAISLSKASRWFSSSKPSRPPQ